MTLFARVNPDTGSTEARDFESAPPASKGWLPLTIDAQPTPTALQTVERGPIVFSAGAATQTWVLVAKPQAVLDREAYAVELAQLQTIAAALQAGTGTAAERIVRVERVCVWLLRQAATRAVI